MNKNETQLIYLFFLVKKKLYKLSLVYLSMFIQRQKIFLLKREYNILFIRSKKLEKLMC